MMFMVKNKEGLCYDPEHDAWFRNHPLAPEYVFAPIKWIREKWGSNE